MEVNKMNKFKFGDKVHIKSENLDGKVIGSEQKIVNGIDCGVKYFVDVLIDDESYIASNVKENDLELITYNECSCDCCDCCGHDVCEDSDYNEDFENELDDDEIEDYKYNKSCKNLDNDKKFNIGNLTQSLTYPKIRDYYYDEKTATTVIKWTDGTTTKVKAAEGDTPDQHTGFANAVAKKYFGNRNFFAREAKWWIIDEPKYRADDEKFRKEYDAEQARKEEKRKKDRENRIIKAKALARKREYEARKLSAEKYGVPMDWQDTDA